MHIELTTLDGDRVSLDPEQVVFVEPAGDDPSGPARICLATEEELYVVQDIEQVIAQIQALGIAIR